MLRKKFTQVKKIKDFVHHPKSSLLLNLREQSYHKI